MHSPSLIAGGVSTGLITIGVITLNEIIIVVGGLAALSTLLLNIYTFWRKHRNKE